MQDLVGFISKALELLQERLSNRMTMRFEQQLAAAAEGDGPMSVHEALAIKRDLNLLDELCGGAVRDADLCCELSWALGVAG